MWSSVLSGIFELARGTTSVSNDKYYVWMAAFHLDYGGIAEYHICRGVCLRFPLRCHEMDVSS